MKIIAVTPFHKRPEVSRIFWQNCNDIELDVIAIVSDKENELLANKHAFKTVNHSNIPLGLKWQHGINQLKEIDFDYCLIIGSDDLISHFLLKRYKEIALKGHEYIGLKDALAIDFKTKRFRHFKGYTNHRYNESIGAGRLVSKRLLEAIDYDVFPNRHKFMDRHLTDKLFEINISNILIKTGPNPYRIGIKTKETLSKDMPNSPFIHDIDLTGWYSEKVIEMLNK